VANEPENVEPIRCETAKQFIEEVSKVSDIGPPDFRNPLVYRGHWDTDWELKPAAWREDGQAKLKPLADWLRAEFRRRFPDARFRDDREHDSAAQWTTEVVAVRHFCDLADQIGLVIPNAHCLPSLLRALESLPAIFADRAFTASDWDIPIAYAQHHGVPTRFLDWTRNPLVAAFFALEGRPTQAQRPPSSICVWVTRPHQQRVQGNLNWITVPRGQHPFVHAQDSVFSVAGNGHLFFVQYGRWPNLLETPHPGNNVFLIKWELPHGELGELRRALFARGISRSRLMPTLDSVSEDTKLRWEWY